MSTENLRNFKIDSKMKVRSEDPLYHLHEYDVDLKNNHIYLMGMEGYTYGVSESIDEPGVEYTLVNRFIRNMNICMRVNHDMPILIHMKTCGGFYEEGMAIFDTIKACPNPVTILNYTHARSMSSIIMQAANKKVTMPNGTFMFHDGTMAIDGTVKQVESYVDFNKRATDVMLSIYVEAMREKGVFKNDSERKKWLVNQMNKKEDVFMTADEAIEYGFFDEKFDGNWMKLTQYTDEQLRR